jgi:hypothetical protein
MGQGKQPQRAASQIAHATQAAPVLAQRFVVRIEWVGFQDGDHGRRGHEARDVVHVTVGVIAGDAAVQPEDLSDSQVIGEQLLILLAVQLRVARLHRAEKTLLGGQQETLAVHINGAALEHQMATARSGTPNAPAGVAGNEAAGRVIQRPVTVSGPAVEAELDRRQLAIRVEEEQRGEVTRPATVGSLAEKADVLERDVGLRQQPPGGAFRFGVLDQDRDGLRGRQVTHDLAINPRDGGELAGPVRPVVWPCDPGGGVGSPLRRQAKTQSRGCVAVCAHSSNHRWSKP